MLAFVQPVNIWFSLLIYVLGWFTLFFNNWKLRSLSFDNIRLLRCGLFYYFLHSCCFFFFNNFWVKLTTRVYLISCCLTPTSCNRLLRQIPCLWEDVIFNAFLFPFFHETANILDKSFMSVILHHLLHSLIISHWIEPIVKILSFELLFKIHAEFPLFFQLLS